MVFQTRWFSHPHPFQKLRFQKLRSWQWLGLGLITLLLTISGHWFSLANPADKIQLPLSTRGAQIIDASGKPVLLRGVNWFGLETEMHAPHGLWSRDYKDMLAQMKGLGYNLIRLPYSVQGLREPGTSGINFSLGSNRELENKSPLEVMDLVIQEAQRQGLMVLLDSHRLNNQRIPELWYGDGFTETDWINTWTMLATRYQNQPNVIGADLKNEPHGRASWGTNDRATDWRLAAERAGNAILAVNPNWLIVVEGVEKNVPGQKLVHWWGGNLEGVGRFPVRLRNPRKLVYSPHEYGAGVSPQPWFNDPKFPRNLPNRWEIGFNYIARRGIAPILIGEFGGRQVDSTSKEGIWQRELVKFINAQRLHFAYWSWNPNSGDTGGILKDDWTTIHADKQALLNQLVPVAGLEPTNPVAMRLPTLPSPSPSSIAPPEVSVIEPPPPSSPAVSAPEPSPAPTPVAARVTPTVQTRIQSDWQTGFCVDVLVTNPGSQFSPNWKLTFEMAQAEINQSWNGSFDRQGSRYTVTPPGWSNPIQPYQTVNLGFCANKLGNDYYPRQVAIITP
jgi:endoglucanase